MNRTKLEYQNNYALEIDKLKKEIAAGGGKEKRSELDQLRISAQGHGPGDPRRRPFGLDRPGRPDRHRDPGHRLHPAAQRIRAGRDLPQHDQHHRAEGVHQAGELARQPYPDADHRPGHGVCHPAAGRQEVARHDAGDLHRAERGGHAPFSPCSTYGCSRWGSSSPCSFLRWPSWPSSS